MNLLKTLLVITIICSSVNTEAQIFKKLSNKVEKAIEKTLEKKVEEKAERETNKAFDSTFNNSKNNRKKAGNIFGTSNAKPSNTYSFSHKYKMQLNDGKNPFSIMYYLNKDDNFLGFEIPNTRNQTISIMDLKKEVMFMFMNTNGEKNVMSINMNLETLTDEAITETEYSVTSTGNTKSILGYPCKEYTVKGKDLNGNVWVTENAGVSFSKTFYKTKQKNGMNQNWMPLIDGLPMEMNITDTSKRKSKTMNMTCVMLKAENFSIETSGYKKLM